MGIMPCVVVELAAMSWTGCTPCTRHALRLRLRQSCKVRFPWPEDCNSPGTQRKVFLGPRVVVTR